LVTPLSAQVRAHPNLACQVDPVYDFGGTPFDRFPSGSVFRPIADLEVDLTGGPPSAIGGHFAVDLQAAVKAAAKAPLIFRQLGRRRILRTDIELVLELLAGRAEVLFLMAALMPSAGTSLSTNVYFRTFMRAAVRCAGRLF
jgi:hypothetical protein